MRRFLLSLGVLLGLGVVAHAAGPNYGYVRPNLYWVGTSSVAVQNNTGTANETMVCFNDGQCRRVVENVSSSSTYRSAVLTSTASWVSGTEASGLLNGMPRQANYWYAVYAVKSQINFSKFVLAVSTWTPTDATNYSLLNSTFGVNGWVYLGLIRIGDNGDSRTTQLLRFYQAGNHTFFQNTVTPTSSDIGDFTGVQLAFTDNGASVSYTYASGMSGTQIPPNVEFGHFWAVWNDSNTSHSHTVRNAANNVSYLHTTFSWADNFCVENFEASPLDGFLLTQGGNPDDIGVLMTEFHDNRL